MKERIIIAFLALMSLATLAGDTNSTSGSAEEKYTKAIELLVRQQNAELKKRFRAIRVMMPND